MGTDAEAPRPLRIPPRPAEPAAHLRLGARCIGAGSRSDLAEQRSEICRAAGRAGCCGLRVAGAPDGPKRLRLAACRTVRGDAAMHRTEHEPPSVIRVRALCPGS